MCLQCYEYLICVKTGLYLVIQKLYSLKQTGLASNIFKSVYTLREEEMRMRGNLRKMFPGIICIIQWQLYLRLETQEYAAEILLTACCHQTGNHKR